MLKASGIDLVAELANSIMSEGLDWDISSIVNSYKGKDDVLVGCN